MIDSIRVRLTLWYVAIFAVLLLFFSIFAYVLIARSLRGQLDNALTITANNAAAAFLTEMNDGNHTEAESAAEVLQQMTLTNFQIAFLSGDKLVAATRFAIWAQPFLPDAQQVSQPRLTTVQTANGETARMIVLPVRTRNREYLIALATPVQAVEEQLAQIRRIFFIVALLSLSVAAGGGYLLARRSLAPVVAMSEQAQCISARNLSERLPIGNQRDELGRLATTFNDLLARMARAFVGLRQFTADAAHEFRSPLAVIFSEADVALSQPRRAEEYQEALQLIKDETRRLSLLVDDMLDLARADAGAQQLQCTEFYLNDLVEECCRATRALAAPKRINLLTETAPDIVYLGDEELLRRLLMNLLNNAVKYTLEDGEIKVSLQNDEQQVIISVADTGIGIPPDAAEHIFDRFFRVDQSRVRTESSTGLGLPIARWIAEAHGGSITMQSEPGRGSIFTVSLPKAYVR